MLNKPVAACCMPALNERTLMGEAEIHAWKRPAPRVVLHVPCSITVAPKRFDRNQSDTILV